MTWATVRDVVIVAVATSILIYETLLPSPSALIVGAALTLLGVPPALLLDARRKRNGNGK